MAFPPSTQLTCKVCWLSLWVAKWSKSVLRASRAYQVHLSSVTRQESPRCNRTTCCATPSSGRHFHGRPLFFGVFRTVIQTPKHKNFPKLFWFWGLENRSTDPKTQSFPKLTHFREGTPLNPKSKTLPGPPKCLLIEHETRSIVRVRGRVTSELIHNVGASMIRIGCPFKGFLKRGSIRDTIRVL